MVSPGCGGFMYIAFSPLMVVHNFNVRSLAVLQFRYAIEYLWAERRTARGSSRSQDCHARFTKHRYYEKTIDMTRFRFILLPLLAVLLIAQDIPESLPLPESLLARLPEPWREVARRLAVLTQANINTAIKNSDEALRYQVWAPQADTEQ